MKLSRYFPLTHDGRQTLMYITFAGSGPVLSLMVMYMMHKALEFGLYSVFSKLAWMTSICLLIVHIGVATFVSFRALKIGKDGISAEGRNIED